MVESDVPADKDSLAERHSQVQLTKEAKEEVVQVDTIEGKMWKVA